jgi:hypothetical protein
MQTSKYANDMMENADVSRNKSKKVCEYFYLTKLLNIIKDNLLIAII